MRLLLFVFLNVICVGYVPAAAETEPMGIASQLAVEVTEVVTGGTWSDGSANGAYRTVTVQSYVPTETVDVFVQWIGSRGPSEPLQIISSVPLREFNGLKLTSASITVESEIEGSAKIIVAGQDASGQTAAMLTFLATSPGRYEVVPPEAVAGK